MTQKNEKIWQFWPILRKNHFYIKFDSLSNARNFKALAQLLREIEDFCNVTSICNCKKNVIFGVKKDPLKLFETLNPNGISKYGPDHNNCVKCHQSSFYALTNNKNWKMNAHPILKPLPCLTHWGPVNFRKITKFSAQWNPPYLFASWQVSYVFMCHFLMPKQALGI